MPPIAKGSTVAVTGAAGFIGSWVVRLLLDRGFCVRACVRDASSEKVAFLRAMPQCTTGRLSLHSCDVNVPGVFDLVFDGCQGVVHSADQLMSREHGLDEHLAALQRTVDHLVASVNKSGTVSRVVFTSSVAAILHESDISQYAKRPVIWDGRYPGQQYTDAKYKENLKANGYAVAKIEAEFAFTAAAAASGGRWDVLITNPGDNFGPIFAGHQLKGAGGTFNNYVTRLLQCKSVPMLGAYHPMWAVDVRDTAQGHIDLLRTTVAKNGDRHLLVSEDKGMIMEDLVARMLGLFPAAAGLETTPEATDDQREELKKNEAYFRGIWRGVELRNDGARRIGMTFRPFEETLRDTAESLIGVCGVKPNMRTSKL